MSFKRNLMYFSKRYLSFLYILSALFLLKTTYQQSLQRTVGEEFCSKRILCNNFENSTQVVCERKLNCKQVQNCTGRDLKKNEKRQILHLHNTIRNLIANGSKWGSGAQYMHVVNWDNEMEYVAKCHLSRCPTNVHTCVDVKRFPCQQIVGFKTDLNPEQPMDCFHRKFWKEVYEKQVPLLNDDLVDRGIITPSTRDIAILLQEAVQWMGCSYQYSSKNKRNITTSCGCNYGPTNHAGLKLFRQNLKEFLQFPGVGCNEIAVDYNALCGKMLPIPRSGGFCHFGFEKAFILVYLVFYLKF